MANEAKIDIKVNDSQVDGLIQSLNRLSNSLNETQREFNQTQREARQTGTAIQNAGRQSQSGGRGIEQMGRKLAGATRAIAAGGAALGAFATAIGVTVVAVKTLEVGIEQSREAFRAYISTAEETKEQFQDLTENASQLQLQLGKTILELIGGEEAFDTLNDAIETGVQFLENFRDAITRSASGLSVADVGARLLRESLALLFRVLAEGQRVLETTVNALNFLSSFNFSNFISQQREIRDTYRDQRDLIRDLRNGTVDLSQRSARDPIRIAVEGGAGGGAGGISEGDRQIISAIEALQTQQAEAQEVLDDNLKRALIAAQNNLPTAMGKAETQMMFEGVSSLPPSRLIDLQFRLGDLLDHQREIRIDQRDAEAAIEESLERQAQIQAGVSQAAAQRARAAQLEAQARDRAEEAQRRLLAIPGSGVPGGVVGGLAGGATTAGVGATGGLLGRTGAIARGTLAAAQRGQALQFLSQVLGRGGTLASGAARFGAASALTGPAGGAAILGATQFGYMAGEERQRRRRSQAFQQQAGAYFDLLEADALNAQAEQIRATVADLNAEQARAQGLSVALGVDLNRLIVEARVNSDAAVETAAGIEEIRFNEEKQAQQFFQDRIEREQDYFDFIQRGIEGTKEEAARYISFIEGTPLEEAFRMGAAAGADPLAASGFARESIQQQMISSVQGGEGFPSLAGSEVGFSLARDLDNLNGFRGIAQDETFPSIQLMLEAINGELTDQERRWASINGGIQEYLKAIAASKKATREAFKADAVAGFEGAIAGVAEMIGTGIAGGFDDGLKGGERVKKLLGNLLGDFLKTIGATAIAQGAIVAFGDPAAGGLPNPVRAAGLIAAGGAAIVAGTMLSRSADRIGGGGGAASSVGAATLSPGGASGGGSNEQTTNIFVENRFGNRFDARELDRAAADSFARAAQAGQA